MRTAALLAAVALLAVLSPPPAGGATVLTGPERAERVAVVVPKIAAAKRGNRGSYLDTKAKDAARWEVNLWSRARRGHPSVQLAQVYVDRHTFAVLEAWTGPQVAWTMARGYPGAFGRSANNPWIFITLMVLFVLPFVDPRRPLQWLHADLLALAGLGASYAWFNAANLDASVPVADGLLLYLLLRLLAIGLGRAQPPPLRLLVPWQWLGIAALFLVGLRVGLNALDGNVIDVGYASVVGADRLEHGRAKIGRASCRERV